MTIDRLMGGPLDKYKGEGIGNNDEQKSLPPVVFDEVFHEYLKYLKEEKRYLEPEERESLTHILTPEQISLFFQMTSSFKDMGDYSSITGYFISGLIENSYRAGYNNFSLKTDELIDSILTGFKATSDRPLKINFQNSFATNNLADYAEHVEAVIFTDNICDFGIKAKYCKFVLNTAGTPDRYSINAFLLRDAENSEFIINGNIRILPLASKNSSYTIHGDIVELEDALDELPFNCEFKFSRKDVYDKVVRELKELPLQGNKIMFIDETGNVKEKTDL